MTALNEILSASRKVRNQMSAAEVRAVLGITSFLDSTSAMTLDQVPETVIRDLISTAMACRTAWEQGALSAYADLPRDVIIDDD